MESKSKSTPLITFIHEISGQLRKQNIIESEHAYAKFWNRHPDPSNKSRPARFLFMQSFAKSSSADGENDLINVDSIDDKHFPSFTSSSSSSLSSSTTSSSKTTNNVTSNGVGGFGGGVGVGVGVGVGGCGNGGCGNGGCGNSGYNYNPLVAEVSALTKGQVTIAEEFAITDSAPNKTTWSNLAQRIWAKALNILYTDRLIRLSIEGTPNEIITKKMISHKCANKFRHLFASLAFWDPSILSWLHSTLLEHVSGQYLIAYHESMSLLRTKLPPLIDRFYLPPAHNDPIRSRNKGPIPDPIQNVLNNHKPKRIKNCPLFILVPNGPQPTNSTSLQRLKHWQLLFASLGKILSINCRHTLRVKDCLNEIMNGVRDKIKECRTTFTEARPIILVGFGHSSLIATHVALEPNCKVTATICLGFPLAGVNGFRGDLDDPLLDTTVPTLFVIGQNATLSSIDDVEDFRERITKTETGLVVVGGANDHLVVSQTKQRFTGITQAIVDRCISDEIYDFINFVMNPHFVPSENKYVSTASTKNLSKTSTGAKGEQKLSKSKSKIDKQSSISSSTCSSLSTPTPTPTPTLTSSSTSTSKSKEITNASNLTKKLGILSSELNDNLGSYKDPEINKQSSISGDNQSSSKSIETGTQNNNNKSLTTGGNGVSNLISNLKESEMTNTFKTTGQSSSDTKLSSSSTTTTSVESNTNITSTGLKKISKKTPKIKGEKTSTNKSRSRTKSKSESKAGKESSNSSSSNNNRNASNNDNNNSGNNKDLEIIRQSTVGVDTSVGGDGGGIGIGSSYSGDGDGDGGGDGCGDGCGGGGGGGSGSGSSVPATFNKEKSLGVNVDVEMGLGNITSSNLDSASSSMSLSATGPKDYYISSQQNVPLPPPTSVSSSSSSSASSSSPSHSSNSLTSSENNNYILSTVERNISKKSPTIEGDEKSPKNKSKRKRKSEKSSPLINPIRISFSKKKRIQ